MIINPYNLGNYIVPPDAFGGVCVDVGANVGTFLDTYADKFSKVHFYEPISQCFEICRKKMSTRPHVSGFNEAVYHTAGQELQLVEHLNQDSGSVALKTDVLNGDWTDKTAGKAKTCDFSLLLSRAGGQIDYLKVDCETGEYHLLNNKDLSKVRYLGIELSWQIGRDRYNQLLRHISKTHVTAGNIRWRRDRNKEALFVRRSDAAGFRGRIWSLKQAIQSI